MNTKLIIENGKTKIILTPDNDFEIDVIEKVCLDKYKINSTNVFVESLFQNAMNHKIIIELISAT